MRGLIENRQAKYLSHILTIKETAELLVSNKKDWKLYRISFVNDSPAAQQFARRLNVKLCRKPAEILPLWPPMILDEKVTSGEKSVRYYSNQYGQFIFLQSDDSFNEKKRNLIFASVGENQKSYTLGTDEEGQSITIKVTSSPFKHSYESPDVEIKWNKNQIKSEKEIHLKVFKTDNTLLIKSNLKCTLVRILATALQRSLTLDEGKQTYIDTPQKREILEIFHGQDKVATIVLNSNTAFSAESVERDDDEIYLALKKQNNITIPYPKKLKYISLSSTTYPKSSAYLRKCMLQGKIRKETADYLMEIISKLRRYE